MTNLKCAGYLMDHFDSMFKRKELGISGKLVQWLYYFLTNRKHFARLRKELSCDHPVISRVPQGNALGPLHFIIMCADTEMLLLPSSLALQTTLEYIKKSLTLKTVIYKSWI